MRWAVTWARGLPAARWPRPRWAGWGRSSLCDRIKLCGPRKAFWIDTLIQKWATYHSLTLVEKPTNKYPESSGHMKLTLWPQTTIWLLAVETDVHWAWPDHATISSSPRLKGDKSHETSDLRHPRECQQRPVLRYRFARKVSVWGALRIESASWASKLQCGPVAFAKISRLLSYIERDKRSSLIATNWWHLAAACNLELGLVSGLCFSLWGTLAELQFFTLRSLTEKETELCPLVFQRPSLLYHVPNNHQFLLIRLPNSTQCFKREVYGG